MKSVLIALMLMLVIPTLSHAQTNEYKGEILAVAEDVNGKLFVFYEVSFEGAPVRVCGFPKDAKTIASRGYPVSLVGKDYCAFQVNFNRLAGLTNAQIRSFLDNEIQSFLERQVLGAFTKKEHERLATLNASALIGRTVAITEMKIQVDLDKDGTNDEEWTLSPDGSKSAVTLP